jgi:hypothetical protein
MEHLPLVMRNATELFLSTAVLLGVFIGYWFPSTDTVSRLVRGAVIALTVTVGGLMLTGTASVLVLGSSFDILPYWDSFAIGALDTFAVGAMLGMGMRRQRRLRS